MMSGEGGNMEMESIAYLNGNFLPLSKLSISPFDRGFLFGDSVYESIPVYHGSPRNLESHLMRLRNSLAFLHIELSLSDLELEKIIDELVISNKFDHQYIYCQVSRGSNGLKRSHFLPKDGGQPTIFIMNQPIDLPSREIVKSGYKAITLPDIRWQYTSIKTTNVLPNVLQLDVVVSNGADEAIYLKNGFVVEGTCSNIFIVKNNQLITPPQQQSMLSGITRQTIIDLAQKNDIPYEVREIASEEIWSADEIWFTNSIEGLLPIVSVDNQQIADGKVGPMCFTMLDYYLDYILQPA